MIVVSDKELKMQSREEIEQRIKVLKKQISEFPTREQLSEMHKADGEFSVEEEMKALMDLTDALHKHDLIYCEKTTLESVLK